MVMGNQALDPEAIKFLNAIMANFHARMEKEYIFTDDELKQLTMPTLLIGGMEDALVPVERLYRGCKSCCRN